MKPGRSLPAKISVAMWVMTTWGTLTAAILSSILLINSHRESVRGQLQAAATSLISLGISDFSELKDFEQLNRFIEDTLQMDKVDKIVRIFDRSGRLAFTTVKSGYDQLPNRLPKGIQKLQFLTLEGESRRYESLILPYRDEGGLRFYLQVVIPLPRYSQMLQSLWWQSLLLLGLLIGASLILSRWLARRLLQPVLQISDHLQQMDPTKIEEVKPLRLSESGHYLVAIIEGINSLVERTRVAVNQMKKMSRYVAHELRNPLTILRGEAETVLAKKDATQKDYELVLKSSLEEVQRMSDIVATVMTVGAIDRPSSSQNSSPIDLIPWLQANKGEWERTLGREIQLDLPKQNHLQALVEPSLFYRLIDNLVRNVRDHTPPATDCSLSLRTTDEGTRLTVVDNGPGIPAGEIDSLNAKGKLAEGAGVGLNLCHRIAELGHLQIHFVNQPSGGLQVEIGLPLASFPPPR